MVILLADAFAPDLPARLKPFGQVVSDVDRVSEAEVLIVRSTTEGCNHDDGQKKNVQGQRLQSKAR